MAALGQGGVTVLSGSNHGALTPIALTAGQTLTLTHGLNRRAFQVITTSGEDANYGQVLTLPVLQPQVASRYDTVSVQNNTGQTISVFVACRWEENSKELSLLASTDSRISIINPI